MPLDLKETEILLASVTKERDELIVYAQELEDKNLVFAQKVVSLKKGLNEAQYKYEKWFDIADGMEGKLLELIEALRAALNGMTKERDEAHAVVHSHAWTIGRLQFENARLRAAIEPTAENIKVYAKALGQAKGIVAFLDAIAARAGINKKIDNA